MVFFHLLDVDVFLLLVLDVFLLPVLLVFHLPDVGVFHLPVLVFFLHPVDVDVFLLPVLDVFLFLFSVGLVLHRLCYSEHYIMQQFFSFLVLLLFLLLLSLVLLLLELLPLELLPLEQILSSPYQSVYLQWNSYGFSPPRRSYSKSPSLLCWTYLILLQVHVFSVSPFILLPPRFSLPQSVFFR